MRVFGKPVSNKSDGSSKKSPSAGTAPAALAPVLTLSNTPSEKTMLGTMAAGMEERQESSPTDQQLSPLVADWVVPATCGSSAASAAVAERVAPPAAHRVGSRGTATALSPTTHLTPMLADPAPAPARPSRPRLEERIAAQMARLPSSWSVAEVVDWLEAFGMGQYRKRFVHNAISGAVLLRLTDQRLRADLGMGSLGHRESLLRAVAELQRTSLGAPDGSSRAMAPSALGPPILPAAPVTVAVVKAQEQRARLLKELSKARVKVAQRRAAAEQASRTVGLAEQEVQRVHDALAGIASRGVRLSDSGEVAAVDFQGTPVWCPAGRVTPTVSKKAMAGAKPAEPAARMEQGAGVSFLDRLEADLAARQAKRDQEAHGRHAPAPVESIAEAEADALSFIKELFADRDAALLEALGSGSAGKAAEALDVAAAQLAADMGLPEKQLEAVKAAKGAAAKAVRLAAAVRTSQFMQRLRQDLAARRGRTKEVQQKWRELEAATTAAHEARDASEAKARFEALGWPGEVLTGGADELLGALLRRATALQQAKPVDWEPFRGDGLLGMQPVASAPAAVPTLPPPPAAPPSAVGAVGPPAGGSAALLEVVELLAACRADELHRLEGLTGQKKMVAVHRALRAQAFIRFTRADLATKATKRKDALAAGKPPRKVVPKEQQEAFLQRLMEDAARRTKNRDELVAKAEAAFMTRNQKHSVGGKGEEGGAKKK